MRIGFAKNNEALGVAFDVEDTLREKNLVAAVCGKSFSVRLISAECVPLDEAPGLEDFVTFDPPRMAIAVRDLRADQDETLLQVLQGETVYITSDDGEGWLYGYFLDPDDPDDGGFLPADGVQFLDDEDDGAEWQGEASKNEADQAELDDDDAADDWDDAPVAIDARETTGRAQCDGGYGESGFAAAQNADDLDDEDASDDAGDAWDEFFADCYKDCPTVEQAHEAAAPPVNQSYQLKKGIADLFARASLEKYEASALEWCLEMGAVSIEEVEESWEDLADALGMKPLERKRLGRTVAGT